MAENSKIEWTTHTMNPWRGCTKVSAGCANCYAETMSGRNPDVLGVWGPSGTRVVAAEAQWREPLKWDKAAAAKGERHRVFCASLADVFEDWAGPMETSQGFQIWKRGDGSWTTSDHYRDTVALSMQDVRARLFTLIDKTPHLDWLLLTKRPQNVLRMTYDAWCQPVPGHVSQNEGDGRHWHWPANVWLGASVENQAAADERIPELLKAPACVRFLSCEPLLGPVDLSKWLGPLRKAPPGIGGIEANSVRVVASSLGQGLGYDDWPPCLDWVIVGGESGGGARPMQIEWARDLLRQCRHNRVPVFVKQLGARPTGDYYEDRLTYEDRGIDWPDPIGWKVRDGQPPIGSRVELPLADRKGGDPSDWPEDLRVREFPATYRPEGSTTPTLSRS